METASSSACHVLPILRFSLALLPCSQALLSGVRSRLLPSRRKLSQILKPGPVSTASTFKGFVPAGSGQAKLSCNCLRAARAAVHLGISMESSDTSLWSYCSWLWCQISVREKRKTVFKWTWGSRGELDSNSRGGRGAGKGRGGCAEAGGGEGQTCRRAMVLK